MNSENNLQNLKSEPVFIDLTHTFRDSMPVFPGKTPEPASLYRTAEILKHGYNNYVIEAGLHVGTHLDTPLHMIEGKTDLSVLPVNRLLGSGAVIDCRDQRTITFDIGTYENTIRENDIVLFLTGHDSLFGDAKYFEVYPELTDKCADFLVNKRVNMVGFDTPSPDKYPYSIHKKLFNADILIMENLSQIDDRVLRGCLQLAYVEDKIK